MAKLGDQGYYEREVDLAPIKVAFRRSGLSIAEVARRMGYAGKAPAARFVAYRTHHLPSGVYHGYSRCSYATALRLCAALDLDPVDMGL